VSENLEPLSSTSQQKAIEVLRFNGFWGTLIGGERRHNYVGAPDNRIEGS
jgi:hypothetical protein